jgi:hypothetical protein
MIKRILFLIIPLLSFTSGLLTAQETVSNRFFGASIGGKLSILGYEPIVSINFSNLELECGVPMISGYDYTTDEHNRKFGYGITGSIGYLSNPFSRGWQNGAGAAYTWFSPAYCNMTALAVINLFIDDKDVSRSLISCYYRGGYRFNSGFNLYFKETFPVVFFCPEIGQSSVYSIIDTWGTAASILTMFVTTSIGIRWEL